MNSGSDVTVTRVIAIYDLQDLLGRVVEVDDNSQYWLADAVRVGTREQFKEQLSEIRQAPGLELSGSRGHDYAQELYRFYYCPEKYVFGVIIVGATEELFLTPEDTKAILES